MPVALLALALGAFGIGTTEFVIVGLLPDIADDLSVTIPVAGLLVTGYALGVVAGVPVMTVTGAALPRKRMLVALMGVFIAGNLLCAVADTYPALLAGRLVAALTHGAFFGIGSVVAADLVAPNRRASAVALMFMGLTVANVLGVPLGTALGQQLGWRATFWAVTGFGIIALAAVAALVPAQPRNARTGMRNQLAMFGRRQVWLALAMTTLGFGGVFAALTYIAPMMTGLAGFDSRAVAWLLVLFGAGLCAGNYLGGRFADRAPVASLYGTLGGLVIVMLVLSVTSRWQIPAAVTVALFGVAGFATVPALQLRVLSVADDAPALASVANIAAFNLGNALGAWLGGAAIDHGYGYAAPNLVGAMLAACGLTVAVLAVRLERATRTTPVSASPVNAETRG